MTIERRCAVEPTDIVEVEYECKCGARSTRFLRGKNGTILPTACGNCGGIYFRQGTPEAQDLEAVLRFLAHFNAKDFPFVLRFEIAGLDEREKNPGKAPFSC